MSVIVNPNKGTAIGSTITGGTANEVLFVGPTGLLAQSPNFKYHYSGSTGDFNTLDMGTDGVVILQAGNLDPGTGGSESSTVLVMTDASGLNPFQTIEGGSTFGASFRLDDTEGMFDFITTQNGDPRLDMWGFLNAQVNYIACDPFQCGQDQGDPASNVAWQKANNPARLTVDGDLYAGRTHPNRYGRNLILTAESNNNAGAGGDIILAAGTGDAGQVNGAILIGGTTPSGITGDLLQLESSSPRLTLHDLGNDAIAFLRATGGEFDILNTDAFNPGNFAGFHIQFGGGNIEYTNTASVGSPGGHVWDVNSNFCLYLCPTDASANVPHILRVGVTSCVGDPGTIGDDGSGGILQVAGVASITEPAASNHFLIGSPFHLADGISLAATNAGITANTGLEFRGSNIYFNSVTSGDIKFGVETASPAMVIKTSNGNVRFGDGTDIGLGLAYMLATNATGNAGFTANTDNVANYASFDLIRSGNVSTGFSMQMQPSDTNLYFVDRVNGRNAITLMPGGQTRFMLGGGSSFMSDSNAVMQLASDGNAANWWFNVKTAASGGTDANVIFRIDGNNTGPWQGFTFNIPNNTIAMGPDAGKGGGVVVKGIIVDSNGNLSVQRGSAAGNATAYLHIKAGTTAASTAPLKFTTGSGMTTAEAGAMEYTTPDLFFTPGSAIRYNLPLVTGAGAQGDLVYASGASIYSRLAKNTTASRYLSNSGTSNNPAWAQIDLTNGVTGTLPVGNGGTGSTVKNQDNVALTNQGADIGTTNFTSGGVAGTYRVSYSLQDTTADLTAGAVTLTIAYTDGAGATTTTANQVLTGVGRTSGSIYLQLASGNVTYAVAHTGIFGTAKYALYLTLERLS